MAGQQDSPARRPGMTDRLGHAKATMTMDVYSHVMPDMQEAAIKALTGMFT